MRSSESDVSPSSSGRGRDGSGRDSSGRDSGGPGRAPSASGRGAPVRCEGSTCDELPCGAPGMGDWRGAPGGGWCPAGGGAPGGIGRGLPCGSPGTGRGRGPVVYAPAGRGGGPGSPPGRGPFVPGGCGRGPPCPPGPPEGRGLPGGGPGRWADVGPPGVGPPDAGGKDPPGPGRFGSVRSRPRGGEGALMGALGTRSQGAVPWDPPVGTGPAPLGPERVGSGSRGLASSDIDHSSRARSDAPPGEAGVVVERSSSEVTCFKLPVDAADARIDRRRCRHEACDSVLSTRA